MKIGFMGPEGSFSQEAAKLYKERFVFNGDLIKFSTITDVLDRVLSGELDYAVVPIENSTEGAVNASLDFLINSDNLHITSQLIMPIKQNLMVKQPVDKIDKIYSHPQALAQCRDYLNRYYNQAEIIPTSSTAEAARFVSMSSENIGAIASEFASEIYNLEIVEKEIQDRDSNFTKFILVSNKNDDEGLKSQTSIVFSTVNKPGELYRILDIFSLWDINMTNIISRPMKDAIGQFVFYVDLEFLNSYKDLEDALVMLQRKTTFFKVLGSYDIIKFL